jgi:phage gp29-like protein
MRSYPADGLSPSRLAAIVREADAGSITAQMALYEQMEEKDGHLFSVAQTRRLAVTGLPWEIVSASDLPASGAGRTPGMARSGDSVGRLADAAADACREALAGVDLDAALSHMALALGRNIAVVELVWAATPRGLDLAELAPVDFERLTLGRGGEVRILTDAAPTDGIALPPAKFIVHIPHAVSGHPARGGLSRVTALAFMAKRFAVRDWLIFAEVFGMPVRIARYAPNATPEEKRELLGMLKQLGADATAVFSKAVEVEIKQTRVPGETNLYENLCLYFDREISKAWLGQTLTTDVSRARASTGVATVHERVRQDIRDDDLRREAATVRRDLLAPLTRMALGPDAPVPHFRRVVDLAQDPERLGRVLDIAVNALGARVPARWAHAALGIPEARAGEPVLGAQRISREGDSGGPA